MKERILDCTEETSEEEVLDFLGVPLLPRVANRLVELARSAKTSRSAAQSQPAEKSETTSTPK